MGDEDDSKGVPASFSIPRGKVPYWTAAPQLHGPTTLFGGRRIIPNSKYQRVYEIDAFETSDLRDCEVTNFRSDVEEKDRCFTAVDVDQMLTATRELRFEKKINLKL